MRASLGLALAAALGAAAVPSTAAAAEGTEIASAFDEGDPYDIFVTVWYAYEARRAAIKREASGRVSGTMEDQPVPIAKDLLYKQTRHILTPRIAIGVFHDLEISAALPIILNDTRSFSFDQRADPCIFPGTMAEPTCINATNSLTFQDGILPLSGSAMGYDAENPTAGFNPATDTMVFRGIGRSGLDQLHLGVTWAPLNQERDDTKPTWAIGVEFRLSIGKIMKFNRLDPGREDGVSPGVHEFRAFTSLSKRTTWSEPYVTLWWQAPIGYRGQEPESNTGTLFWDMGFGQEPTQKMQQAGVTFGFEAIPWENPRQKQKISLQFQGRVEAHFEGRGYSEMWEIYSLAGDKSNPMQGPLVLDGDPVQMGQQAMSHPGVGMIENYMTFAGRFGVRGQVGAHAQFAATFELANDQKHRISWDDAGEDRDDDANDIIDQDSPEVNPLHARVIDVNGRRYLADENVIYTFMVTGSVLF